MKYYSTRDNSLQKTSMEVIKQGLSAEGGLFVPESIPAVSMEELSGLLKADYRERAKKILSMYLTDYSSRQLTDCVEGAYSADNFSSPETAPVTELEKGLHVLELWHGPTCAFKDMALQILPYLMTTAVRATGDNKEILILTATSGDTGKAAMEGFSDIPGTRILVFYPQQGVSPMQKLQMVTQEGSNVMAAAVKGNFDDAQTGVKQVFRDEELRDYLDKRGLSFSSANSINWGRLVPQIVYYFSSYLDLVRYNRISLGEPVNIVVPTGNFGNILAAWYAREMGLPVNRLICASNDNKVLADFIRTGVYDKRREFYQTISPSMDILVSSNLERLLYELAQRDDAQVKDWMKQLSYRGFYQIKGEALKRLQSDFWGGSASVEETMASIQDTYQKTGYVMDPHTAVGNWVYDSYRRETGDTAATILVSTASPFKFPADVLKAIQPGSSGSLYPSHVHTENIESVYEIKLLEQLAKVSGWNIPKPLQGLQYKEIRHRAVCSREQIREQVIAMIDSQEMR